MRSTLDRLRVLTLRGLRVHLWRAVATVVVVAASTALLVTVLSILTSLDSTIADTREAVVGDSALLVSAHSEAGMPAGTAVELGRIDGVRAAVPVLRGTVATDAGDLPLLATDRSADAVGSTLADALGPHVGALLGSPNAVLAGPRTGLREGEVPRAGSARVRVVGVLDGPRFDRLAGGRYLVTSIPVAQRLTGRPDSLDSVLLVAAPGASTDALRADVERVMAGRAAITSPDVGGGGKGVELIRYTALSSAALSALVAGFLVHTVVVLSLAQRRRVVALQRVLGARPRVLAGDCVLESALLALVGGVLGVGVGILLGRGSVARLPALFLQGVTGDVVFRMPWWVPVVAVAAAVAVASAATVLAARRIARVSPVEALSPVEVSAVDRTPRSLRGAVGVAGLVLAVAAFVVAHAPVGIAANAGISVLFTALVLLGWALAGPVVRLTAAAAGVVRGPGVLAAESVRRAPRRVWATVMTVAVAVAATFAISAGNADAVRSATDSFSALGRADLWAGSSLPGDTDSGVRLDSAAADRVRAVPGVASVTPLDALRVDLGGDPVQLVGLAAGTAHPLEDPVLHTSAPTGTAPAVVSRDLADARHLAVGDRVEIDTPGGPRAVEVERIVPYFSGLTGAIALDTRTVAGWFGVDRPATLELRLSPGADRSAVADAVRTTLPPGALVLTGAQARDQVSRALDQATELNNLIWMIVVLIGAVSVFATLSLAVVDRRREIGVLRAVGASRRFVLRMVLVECAAVAVVGGGLGLLFGVAEQAVAAAASSSAWGVDVSPEPVPLSMAMAAVALLVCLVGGVLPARRAASTSVVGAIGAR